MKQVKSRFLNIENINSALIICASFTLIFLGYLVWLATSIDQETLPYLTLPLILGLILENRRLDKNWKVLALKLMLASICASVISFFKILDSDVSTEIALWPYLFIIFFAIFSAIYHDKKVTPVITEGTTLLQSISIIYWIIHYNYLSFSNFFEAAVLFIGLLFCLLSFYTAFSYTPLTSTLRLVLSIWSAVIMLAFSIVYIYRVIYHNDFGGNYFIDNSMNFIQYFLLGISLIYLIQNARMVIVYIPSKNSFFDRAHLKRIARMNKLHLWRYSKEQVKVKDSLLILGFTSVVFFFNYSADLIPPFTMIWLVFWSAPIIIFFKNRR
ncbi:hypothetical protein [Salinimicrobium xinjiangense]|uniref:hypothetical protein n=1 Tax=Salinimicrobium xinjiangense TaxID=438596 RepID=UPI00041A169B|nr:hypothetical protein [Salinimicrobium xinjiangense]